MKGRWWVVAASVLGMIVGQGPICIFTISVFMKPVATDLGVSRGAFASTAILLNVLAAVATPVFGRLVDRFGVRAVTLPMIVLFALSTAALSLLQASFASLYLLFGLQGLFSAAQTPTGYAKAISARFGSQRGLALGIAMAGVGLGVALVPQLAAYLIRSYGWRVAYAGLGIAIVALAAIPVGVFIREPAEPGGLAGARQPGGDRLGVTAQSAIRGSGAFWCMTAAFVLAAMAVNGTLAHIVPLLADHGMPVGFATTALSVSGLSLIAGRILAGYCLDRMRGSRVAWFFFLCPMAGIAIFATPLATRLPLMAAALCGMGIGGEIDIVAYFVGRYFGLKSFATIYSATFAFVTIGSGVGSYLMGLSFDLTGSYLSAFSAFEAALGIACVLVNQLGPYRFSAGDHHNLAAAGALTASA